MPRWPVTPEIDETLEDRRAVRAGDLADNFLALVFKHVGDHHLGALAGKDPRHAGPHPRGAAGDQRDLAIQPHGLLPAPQLTPTAPPRVSPMPRWITRSAMSSSPVGSRL